MCGCVCFCTYVCSGSKEEREEWVPGNQPVLLSELKVSLRSTEIPYQKEGGREKSALIKINICPSEAALARHSGTSLNPRTQEAEKSIFCKFNASLAYKASFRPASATYWDYASYKQKAVLARHSNWIVAKLYSQHPLKLGMLTGTSWFLYFFKIHNLVI